MGRRGEGSGQEGAPWGRVGAGLFSLFWTALVIASVWHAVAASGSVGTPGTFTARTCHKELVRTADRHCVGTFESDDGKSVDEHASVTWNAGAVGRSSPAQADAGGDYAIRDPVEVFLGVLMAVLATPAAVAFGCAALPAERRERLVDHMPQAFRRWYWQERRLRKR